MTASRWLSTLPGSSRPGVPPLSCASAGSDEITRAIATAATTVPAATMIGSREDPPAAKSRPLLAFLIKGQELFRPWPQRSHHPTTISPRHDKPDAAEF